MNPQLDREAMVSFTHPRHRLLRWKRAVARGICCMTEQEQGLEPTSPTAETLRLRRAELRSLWLALAEAERG